MSTHPYLLFTAQGVSLRPSAPKKQAQYWKMFLESSELTEPAPWPQVLKMLCETSDEEGVAARRQLQSVLRFPPIARAYLILKNHSVVERPEFKVSAHLEDWLRDRIQQEDPEIPLVTMADGEQQLLSEPIWKVLCSLTQPPPTDASTPARLRWWGALRKLATKAGAVMPGILRNTQVGVVDKPTLILKDRGDNEIEVCVEDDGLSSDETGSLLRAFRPHRPVATLRDGESKKRVVFTENGRRALKHIAKHRIFRGSEAAALAENPEAFFPEDLFDLSEYSDRVIAIGPPRYRAAIVIQEGEGKTGWSSGLGERLILELTNTANPEDDIIHIDLTEAEARDEARRSVKEALATEQEFTEILGHQVRVDPEIAMVLGDVTSVIEDKEPEEEEEDLTKGLTLQIQENVEELEFGVEAALPSIPEDYRCEIPPGLEDWVELRDHQKQGVALLSWWFDERSKPIGGGLLADDMGLGKTLQVLVVLAKLAEQGALRPSLVVAPVALLDNWNNERSRFVPSAIKKVAFLGDIPRGKESMIHDYDLVLTSYESLFRRDLALGKIPWKVIVCDEAQKIKNPTTRMSQAVKAMKSEHRIAMTGTPVENSLEELWSISDFFQPGLLGSLAEFRETYASKKVLLDEESREQASKNLRKTLNPVLIRRMKCDVAKDLPQLIRKEIPVEMSPLQHKLYATIRQDMSNGGGKRMLALILSLLKVCAHPGLVAPEARDEPFPKLTATLEILDAARERGEKALIFVRFLDLQELLKETLDARYGTDVKLLNGKVNPRYRQVVVDKFSEGEGFDVLLLTPRSCGVGLNITAANHVIHYTREWNPAIEAQATDRAYRIGQKKDVTVYLPIVDAKSFVTVERTLAELLENKDELRRDFLQPTGEIKLVEFTRKLKEQAKLKPTVEPEIIDPYKQVTNKQMARTVAIKLWNIIPTVQEYSWGAVATNNQDRLVVCSDPASLKSLPKGSFDKTTLLLRKRVSAMSWLLRRRMKGLADDVQFYAGLSTYLQGLPVSPSDMLVSSTGDGLPLVTPSQAEELVVSQLRSTQPELKELATRLMSSSTGFSFSELASALGCSQHRVFDLVEALSEDIRRTGAPVGLEVGEREGQSWVSVSNLSGDWSEALDLCGEEFCPVLRAVMQRAGPVPEVGEDFKVGKRVVGSVELWWHLPKRGVAVVEQGQLKDVELKKLKVHNEVFVMPVSPEEVCASLGLPS